MLSSDLNPHALDRSSLPLKSIRDGFGSGLCEAAERDERIVALCADVADSVRLGPFRERFPDRYIELGVAEQNMVAVAAGLAAYGKVPFTVAYAAFSPGRSWEQVRTLLALSDLPVKVVGMHTGVSVGRDGATHQALEDITLMRVLPNVQVVVPCDAEEARKAVLALAWNGKPAYLRCARHETPVFTTPDTPFVLEQAYYLWHSAATPHAAIVGAGPLLYEALEAAHLLEQEGVPTSVLNVHSVKPMDIEAVKNAAREAGAVVTVEEHQILGGIGGTVAEIITQNVPVPQEMIAVHDRFGQSGETEELMREYRLSAVHIVEAVRRVISRKCDGS